MRPSAAQVAAFLVLAALALGCRGGDGSKLREFARVSDAIRRVRAAPNETKEAHLVQLRSVDCQELCALKTTCLEAYEVHVRALGSLKRAKELANSSAARAADELGLAEALLRQAREATTACADLEGRTKEQLRKGS